MKKFIMAISSLALAMSLEASEIFTKTHICQSASRVVEVYYSRAYGKTHLVLRNTDPREIESDLIIDVKNYTQTESNESVRYIEFMDPHYADNTLRLTRSGSDEYALEWKTKNEERESMRLGKCSVL